MIHQMARGATLLAAIVLLINSASGQGGPERIVVRDKKDGSTKSYDGTLKFGAVGLQIVGAEGKVLGEISPADIVKVVPGDLPGLENKDKFSLVQLEDKHTRKDNEAARQGYIDLIQKGGNLTAKTKQYLVFKKALTGTRILDDAEDEEFAKQADAMVKEWVDYLAEYKTGWEIWLAARTTARLNIELNKYADVERVWKQLTGKDFETAPRPQGGSRSPDDRCANPRRGLRLGVHLGATLAKDPAVVSATLKDKLAIYTMAAKAGEKVTNPDDLNAAVKEIEAKIAASKDNSVRAVGYSTIGELYLAAKRPRDAMWAFLWVETVFNSDKDEVMKAMVRLSQIFKMQMDDDREKLYREKIRRMRSQLS